MFYQDSRVDLEIYELGSNKLITQHFEIQEANFISTNKLTSLKGGKNPVPFQTLQNFELTELELIFNGINEELLNFLLPLQKDEVDNFESFLTIKDKEFNISENDEFPHSIELNNVEKIIAATTLTTTNFLIENVDYRFENNILFLKELQSVYLVVVVKNLTLSYSLANEKRVNTNIRIRLQQGIQDVKGNNYILTIDIPKATIINGFDYAFGNLGRHSSNLPLRVQILQDCFENNVKIRLWRR